MTGPERRALLGDTAVNAAQQSARDAEPPTQELLDAVAVLVAVQHIAGQAAVTPSDAA